MPRKTHVCWLLLLLLLLLLCVCVLSGWRWRLPHAHRVNVVYGRVYCAGTRVPPVADGRVSDEVHGVLQHCHGIRVVLHVVHAVIHGEGERASIPHHGERVPAGIKLDAGVQRIGWVQPARQHLLIITARSTPAQGARSCRYPRLHPSFQDVDLTASGPAHVAGLWQQPVRRPGPCSIPRWQPSTHIPPALLKRYVAFGIYPAGSPIELEASRALCSLPQRGEAQEPVHNLYIIL